MANPTRGWDRIPYFGWWFDNPGVPSTGDIDLLMDHRVRRVDGRAIYPGGARRTLRIGKPEDQDPEIRAQIKAAMKALAIAERGEEWDEAAWEARWDANLPAAIFTSFWAADDPDITPHGSGDDGYRVRVVERLDRATGKEYATQPLIAHLDLPVPGVNLADIDVPPGAPSAPAPIYAKGQPGGIPALDADGDVVNAQGVKVGTVDPTQIGQAVADHLTEFPVDGLPEGGTVGQVLARTGPDAAGWMDPPTGGGDPGASAYELAVADGFEGTEAEWLASLQGQPGGAGGPGPSAYEVAVANGFVGTEAEWLTSLKGDPGESGDPWVPPIFEDVDAAYAAFVADEVAPGDAVFVVAE